MGNIEGIEAYKGVEVKDEGIISIEGSLLNQNQVLKRSLVGEFNATTTLTEVRRWANNLWKLAHGLMSMRWERSLSFRILFQSYNRSSDGG